MKQAANAAKTTVKAFAVVFISQPPDQGEPNRMVPQPQGAHKIEVHCANRKAKASIAIKLAINNNEIVAATAFAFGHEWRP